MKIIALLHNNTLKPQLYLLADSSLLHSGKPFFVPNYAPQFCCAPQLVLRIGRLGKNISERFAHRYIDAVTVGATVYAGTPADGPSTYLQSAEQYAFDGAAMLGDFVTLPSEETVREALDAITATCHLADKEIASLSTAAMPMTPTQIVSHLSQFFTLKMGDIIYTGCPVAATPLTINERLRAVLADQEVLNIKIK